MNPLSKKIFLLVGFFFVLLHAYGVYYYDLRLQFEGSMSLVYFSGEWGYQSPMHRYAFILNKFLLFPAFWLHLPIKAIAILFCLNDALFYLAVAFIIIRLTKKYAYATAVLMAPFLIHGQHFYFIVNEIFLSGSLLLLFTAVTKHAADGPVKKAIQLFSLFFVIWSHPIMLLGLPVFLPFIYPSFRNMLQAKWMLLFIALNCALRISLLSGYDTGKLSTLSGSVTANVLPGHLLVHYLSSYWVMALSVLVAAYMIISSGNKFQYSGLLVLPVLIVYATMTGLQPTEPYFVKMLYPVHLFVLLQLVIFVAGHLALYPKTAITLIILVIGYGFTHNILSGLDMFKKRAEGFVKLNQLCRAQNAGHSKWMIAKENIGFDGGSNTGGYTESMFFSSIEKHAPVIQVVWYTNENYEALKNCPEDSFYINNEWKAAINKLDPFYFNLRPGKYIELNDSVKLQ